MRFLLIPGRTNKQGVQINVGKDEPAYQEIVNTMTMHAEDMKELGVIAEWCRLAAASPRGSHHENSCNSDCLLCPVRVCNDVAG
jgi:hypothetical protein